MELDFIDRLLEHAAKTYIVADGAMRNRIGAVDGEGATSSPSTPAPPSTSLGGKILQTQPGPTKGEADFLPAQLTAMTGLLKLRYLIDTGAAPGAKAGTLGDEVKAGLKTLFAGQGPPPLLIEGDEEDPEKDVTILGYEPAVPSEAPPPEEEEARGVVRPEAPGAVPAAPASGPRTPGAPPPATRAAAPGPAPMESAFGMKTG